MTYADKYALLKAYKICTGDDPDTSQIRNQNKTQTLKNYYCNECKQIITREIAAQSYGQFKKCLCLSCTQKAKEKARAS